MCENGVDIALYPGYRSYYKAKGYGCCERFMVDGLSSSIQLLIKPLYDKSGWLGMCLPSIMIVL